MNKKLLTALAVALVALMLWVSTWDCDGVIDPEFGIALSCRSTPQERYQPVFVWRFTR